MVEAQQDKINKANETIVKLRMENERMRKEKQTMEGNIEEVEGQKKIPVENVVRNLGEVQKEEQIKETNCAKVGEKSLLSLKESSPLQWLPQLPSFVYGIPIYYVPVRDARGTIGQRVPVERTTQKLKGAIGVLSKFLCKKKSRQDMVKLVSTGELDSMQLVQLRVAMEKGLTEGQLLELIHNKIPADQMKEIIEIAVLENCLEE
jgi:hypothetical protein